MHLFLRAPRRFHTATSWWLPLCGAGWHPGWHPAAEWHSACREQFAKSDANQLTFAACRYVGQVDNLRRIGNPPFAKCSAS
jgi:hypothetical protein